MIAIDINADIGESFGNFKVGNDSVVIKSITSANIACGYHAGDHKVMNRTIKLAKENKVGIGAHPGYRDIFGFGRRKMDMPYQEIYEMVIYQLGAMQAFCNINKTDLIHVKPHGALYNDASVNRTVAEAIVDAVYDIDAELIIFALCGSELESVAKSKGMKVASEAFADRRYTAQGKLVSRMKSNAVLTKTEEVVEQVIHIVKHGKVVTEDKTVININADTLCFHGDNDNVTQLIQTVKEKLDEEGIVIKNVGES